MRLLVYSYFPVLANYQLGGAQQIMHDLLTGFAAAGLDITVLCPESNDPNLLVSKDNIQVLPVLKASLNRSQFPYEQFHNWQQIKEHAQQVDIIWTLDRSFPLEMQQPIVLTLDQFSYQAEMESLLSLTWDVLAVSSRYLWNIANAIVGPEFWEGDAPSINLIPYGIDTELFSSVDPESLRSRLGLSKSASYLLFPHRPDPNKGFDTVLKVLCQLYEKDPSYKLLIPINPTYKTDRRYYNLILSKARELRVDSAIILHEWIPLNDLPAYFSLGKWTLALGTFPEGFGLTPVQSISCGTSVISTRAGALDEQFPPEHGVQYVDFDAVDQVVRSTLRRPSNSELSRGRAFVEEHYGIDRLIKDYLNCFEKARKRSARYNPLVTMDSIRLSPWCHLTEDSVIWHDYRMKKYRPTRKEADLIRYVEQGIPLSSGEDYQSQVAKLLARGILWGNRPVL